MKKTDIYNSLGMNEFFQGDSFEYDISDVAPSIKEDGTALLDDICTREQLTPLNDGWNKLTFEVGSKLLMSGMRFNLAYRNVEQTPIEKAKSFHDAMLSRVNQNNCVCYSNWDRVPGESTSAGWDPLTESTFDMGVVFVDNHKVVFTYFTAED